MGIPTSATPTPVSPAEPVPLQGPPQLARVALPAGVITKLPGRRPHLAWTVDDGMDADVVGKYIEFAAETGTRLTLFINGAYPAWTKHAALLRPLVTSGQIQLGNHTWNHPNLTKLSDSRVVAELQRNHDFITSTYGVDARPYFRPPYGLVNVEWRRRPTAAPTRSYSVPAPEDSSPRRTCAAHGGEFAVRTTSRTSS